MPGVNVPGRDPYLPRAGATIVRAMILCSKSTAGRRFALTVTAALVLPVGCGPADVVPASTPAAGVRGGRPAPVSVMPVALPTLAARPGALAARIVVRRDTSTFGVGAAVVTLASGDTVTVADSAVRAWKLGDGRLVAVSGLDGAGGYENEGQSLTVIDLQTGERRRVVADYFAIIDVQVLAAGATRALLVHMRDGGVGSMHVTVVDPDRGQIFRTTNALGRVTGDGIVVTSYGDTEEPVVPGDRRVPLRTDTIPATAIDTMSLLVIPRSAP